MQHNQQARQITKEETTEIQNISLQPLNNVRSEFIRDSLIANN